MNYLKRKEVLSRLINFSGSLASISADLTKLPWDSEYPIIILNYSHLKAVLRRYLSNEISRGDLEKWANLIEGRDDIDFDYRFSDRIKLILHKVANPKLMGEIDESEIENWMAIESE